MSIQNHEQTSRAAFPGGAISPAFVVLLCATLSAQVTERVSLSTGGALGNDNSDQASISADGRYVAFASLATNLVAGDTNGVSDIFVRDRQTGTTVRASVATGGAQADGASYYPSISADGRYVAFLSHATNLVPGDTNGLEEIFVRDRQTGTTERVSVATGGAQADGFSFLPSISADGRYVAFSSTATNLVTGDTNHAEDVFVRDRQIGTTECVSLDSSGVQGNNSSLVCAISADGRYVAFGSFATNLVAGDTNGANDIFVRDRQTGTTERVSVATGGAQGNFGSQNPSISADGRYVAFTSDATNLVPGDTNGREDVFVHDRQAGTTERVSLDSGGAQGNDLSDFSPSISADGRYVAFMSYATNLVPGDTNGVFDVFVRDRHAGTTERMSVATGGWQGNGTSELPSISANGRYVAFESSATNLVPGDSNGSFDIYVRDRDTAGFTSLCDPGAAGVIPCPCLNAPSGPDRGCDNSSTTGGASLSAAGVASVSSDSLVFTTGGEKPTATSIVLQGTAFASSGVTYGQGVRCVGGSLKRLYVKSASAGSILAPDVPLGDPPVTVRSAARGDVIQGGQSRWYLVYYRDPTVLGGCPAGSTFNATQTGRIDWAP
jgi:Tol biopolymer transport system component